MPINADKLHLWKADIARSVDFYNDWFMSFAPEAYRTQRVKQAQIVETEMQRTNYLRNISPELLKAYPSVLPLLRMATAPPLARDRLAGLAYVNRSLINSMEGTKKHPPRIPPRISEDDLMGQLERICDIIEGLIDEDLCPWKNTENEPLEDEIERAALVLADRLSRTTTDPIIRNAQEKRQLKTLHEWLERHDYEHVTSASIPDIIKMAPGTFTFLHNVPVTTTTRSGQDKRINITVDALVMPYNASPGSIPIIIEAKSAGDFTNPNKRQKEEAQKANQLRAEYGPNVRFILFLCGYFDSRYLGYEAAEGLDWVWEHRSNDLAKLGLADDSSNGENPSSGDYGDSGDSDPPIIADPDPGFSTKEAKRLILQRHLDAQKTQLDRNKLGQFATPSPLAEDMVRYAATLLPEDESIAFLEPALGTGAFFSALTRVFPKKQIRRAKGFEIDPHYGRPAKELWKDTLLDVELADFTEANPHAQPPFDLLITNPPYSRHHHLSRADKERFRAQAARLTGTILSGLSGLYVYFIYLAHAWLRGGGIGGWLIPSDFMYVNYGKQLRDYLLDKVTLLHVHQFDPEDVQFDNALVSSTVLWLKKEISPPNHEVLFTYGGSLLEPTQFQRVDTTTLRKLSKWHRLFARHATPRDGVAVRLGDLFTIKRGLATGANKFFIMTPEEATERELPNEFLTPILPSPRYLPDDIIKTDIDGLPAIGHKLFLLNCRLPEREVKANYPSLWRYLQEGVTSGISERYLCSKRSPWYLQEEREPAPLLCSYMGRSAEGKATPFRFILNHSQAIAPNVYLNLYPKPHVKRALTLNPDLISTVWEALRAISVEALLSNGRTYGGGLHKLEPNELMNAPIYGLSEELAPKEAPQRELFLT